jgi:hypothetical protein
MGILYRKFCIENRFPLALPPAILPIERREHELGDRTGLPNNEQRQLGTDAGGQRSTVSRALEISERIDLFSDTPTRLKDSLNGALARKTRVYLLRQYTETIAS